MNSVNGRNFVLYVTGLLIMFPIVMVRGVQLGLLFLLGYCFFLLLDKKKIYYDNVFLILFLLLVFTTVILSFSGLGSVWKSAGKMNFYSFTIVAFFNLMLRNFDSTDLESLLKGIKHGCIVQIVWSVGQYFLYSFFSIDINTIIFCDLLHAVDNASRVSILDGSISASGLGWHPALLVPIILLSYLCFDSILFKGVLFFVVIISKSSTCLLALLLCILLDIIKPTFKEQKGIKKKKLLSIFIGIFILLILLLTQSNYVIKFVDSITRLVERVGVISSGTTSDISTSLHYRYYSSFAYILKRVPLKNALFGFGVECSGYPYTLFLGQYNSYGAWSVESDFVNFIFGRGIIWTLVFYTWIILYAIKGMKITYKYFIFYFCILFCGFLYNNQFQWVLVIESIFAYCIDKKINIFI